MQPNPSSSLPVEEADPWGHAAMWLRSWLHGSGRVGLPDLDANSLLIASDEGGERVVYRFRELGWQPVLLPWHLERWIRASVMYDGWRQKTASDLLTDTLTFLRRDFAALLSEGRDDAWTPVQLSYYARIVQLAQSRLHEHPGSGGLQPSEHVEGWGGLAAVAYSIATTAAARAGRSPSLIPKVPASCSGYDELSAYLLLLDEAALKSDPVRGSSPAPPASPTASQSLLSSSDTSSPPGPPPASAKSRRGHLPRAKREEQLLGYFAGGQDPAEHRRRLTASYRKIADETGIPLRTVQRIMESPKSPALNRLVAQRLQLAKEM